jgi:hypothetical protein
MYLSNLKIQTILHGNTGHLHCKDYLVKTQEITAYYCDNFTKCINMLSGQKEGFMLKINGTYSYHSALNS